MDHEYLFSITMYRDGTLRIDGKGRRDALPDILRMIALSLEAGHTALTEYGDDDAYRFE
jgi:hypothetical protein